jgi:hypothetical protein
MAKTFDNISESSATNYLFLFAQRTLALQNEPPTPPPLNALGLPCKIFSTCKTACLLWAWVQKQKQQKHLDMANEDAAPVEVEEPSASENAASAKLKGMAAKATADKVRLPTVGSWSFSTGAWSFATGSVAAQGDEKLPIEREAMLEDRAAAEASAEGTQMSAKKEKTFAEKIQPLAGMVTEYILNHQDDAAQEDRWRTTMKRETMKCFREQREASGNQRTAINRQREEVQAVKAEVNMQIKAEMQAMQLRFDEVHSKMDRKMDQLVKNIADLVK